MNLFILEIKAVIMEGQSRLNDEYTKIHEAHEQTTKEVADQMDQTADEAQAGIAQVEKEADQDFQQVSRELDEIDKEEAETRLPRSKILIPPLPPPAGGVFVFVYPFLLIHNICYN